MERTAAARVARRTFLVLLGVLVVGALGAGTALATPGLGAAPRLPLHGGVSVDLACSNPANAGRTGSVLGAANATAGGQLRCFSRALGKAGEKGPLIMAGPTGLGPAQIQSAYKLAGLNASGRTVAIVDAYNDPKAASDLATYRNAYGLPACTVSNGCFEQINQNGATSPLPSGDYGWAEEISLDLDAVSAACPTCHILLVSAKSASTSDLATAVNTAAKQPGVAAISNSYGGSEASSETSTDSAYNHPGIAVTASSGDSGYGVEYPAASRYVTAVGGTTLSQASGTSRGWTETAWSGAGSGCSAYEAKPAWQTDTGCAKRTVADVSADADPNSGLGVYDTYNQCGSSSFCDYLIEVGAVQGLDGWAQVGGTSLSSPLVASVYALAGNSASTSYGSYPYSHPSSLFDVTSGSNSTTGCTPSYLCTAGAGYDGPTGLGTPNGTGAF
ncbi:MAG TPA: S53 family peptidase [Solirubrobacteraceae bacterium]|nr:S53 family peptidase [Solirubrobacteraceae bacterium]